MSLATDKLKIYHDGSWRDVASYTSSTDVSANPIKFYNGSAWRYVDLSVYPASNRASKGRVYSGGVWYAIMNEILAELPSGIIIGFTSNPGTGWTAVGWSLRFPRGSAVPGGTSEAAHTHTVTIPISSTQNASPETKITRTSVSTAVTYDRVPVTPFPTHKHNISEQVVVSGSGDNLPSFIDIVFYRKD